MIDPGFTTSEMEAVFAPGRRVEAMLHFEAALAAALADTGIAPKEEADAVAEACRIEIADPEAILQATWAEGTPVIALLDRVRSGLSKEADRWLHHGATTQDVVDTATMLQASQALDLIDAGLTNLARHLSRLLVNHRDQPQMGRTFLQHARPTTFGMRVAGWLEPVLRHLADLRQANRELVVQLGGPVGDLAPYGDRGTEVVAALAGHLDLEPPAFPWHTDRSRVAELVATVERCARTMARIAVDVALLASTEVAEVRVRSGGSSSMAGKRNPIDSVRAVAAAEACSGIAGTVTGGRPGELDRGIGAWHAEWLAVPLVFQTTAAAVEAMGLCIESLEVDADRMAANLGQEKAPDVDPRLIDRVAGDYQRMIGGER